MVRIQGKGGLFRRTKILLLGSFPAPGPPKSSLQSLLQSGDANLLATAEDYFRALQEQRIANVNKRNKVRLAWVRCRWLV